MTDLNKNQPIVDINVGAMDNISKKFSSFLKALAKARYFVFVIALAGWAMLLLPPNGAEFFGFGSIITRFRLEIAVFAFIATLVIIATLVWSLPRIASSLLEASGRVNLSPERMYYLATYNIVLIVLCSTMLILLVADGPYLPDQASEPNPSSNPPLTQPQAVLLPTLITMLVAGAAEGTLCNLRGIFKHNAQKGEFPSRFEKPFYIRPFIGAATGLFAFFLGNFVNSSLSDASGQSWAYLSGRLPYIAVALLAGFVAQEFMQRLKEVGKTVFSETNNLRAAERLAELKRLLAQNLISKEDYERKYQEILNEL